MAYRILHIFQNNDTAEESYEFTSPLLQRLLIKLGILKKKNNVKQKLEFHHTAISPQKLTEVIKDQVAHLRSNKLSPLCIFIGSQDYINLCEYSSLSLIEQISYIESIKILEEIKTSVPMSQDESSLNTKALDIIGNSTKNLINRKYKRIPGSLIVSGYKFLNLPIIILPWLSGVFVSPDLSEPPEPNTTFI